MSLSIRETEKFKRGRNGEQLVADLLKRNGWFVIPSYDYSGEDDHPPRMEGLSMCLILPDLDASKWGRRIWIEVKTKAEPTLYKKANRLEHGIPWRHYEHYLKVERETGSEVYLTIYEEKSDKLLCQKLSKLGTPRKYDGPKMSHGGMAFWPRDSFRERTQW